MQWRCSWPIGSNAHFSWEGPAGVGKTELAKAAATAVGARLIRLQCYEGLDESRALYEWNYRKQLLRIQASPSSGGGEGGWSTLEENIFGESFLLARPLLEAIRAEDEVVLLVDEVDRVEVETEALLLEVLAEFQVTIPELGTVRAERRPLVILTSNSTRELGEALRRRCLFLPLDYPEPAREAEIIRTRAPGIDEQLAADVARFLQAARRLDLRKRPSISEAIDWARAHSTGAPHADRRGCRGDAAGGLQDPLGHGSGAPTVCRRPARSGSARSAGESAGRRPAGHGGVRREK